MTSQASAQARADTAQQEEPANSDRQEAQDEDLRIKKHAHSGRIAGGFSRSGDNVGLRLVHNSLCGTLLPQFSCFSR